MGKASETCVTCLLHFILAIFLMGILLWGFDGGIVLSTSQSALTGMAVANTPAQGVLTVSTDSLWYIDILEQQSVSVRFIEGSSGVTLVISGDQDRVVKALLDVAGQAQRRGHLVSYSLNIDPSN